MPSTRQKLGFWAESVAADFLRAKGYSIIARHVTGQYGEIDILAKDHEMLVAVEVKARRTQTFGRAIEGVTNIKLERLAATIDAMLEKSFWPEDRVRLDVVTVEPDGIEHLVGVG